MVYDVDFYLEKFEAIPEKLWCVGKFWAVAQNGFLGKPYVVQCSLGLCGETTYRANYESFCLRRLFLYHIGLSVADVNDGNRNAYQQPTPKQRILAALYDIKQKLALAEAERILSEGLMEEKLLTV